MKGNPIPELATFLEAFKTDLLARGPFVRHVYTFEKRKKKK
jgi:hypothetical protein